PASMLSRRSAGRHESVVRQRTLLARHCEPLDSCCGWIGRPSNFRSAEPSEWGRTCPKVCCAEVRSGSSHSWRSPSSRRRVAGLRVPRQTGRTLRTQRLARLRVAPTAPWSPLEERANISFASVTHYVPHRALPWISEATIHRSHRWSLPEHHPTS